MTSSINLRIKKIRTEINATQAQIAEALGVTRQTISHIERGIYTPSDQLLKFICKEYGVREEWIRTGKGKMKKSPEEIIGEAISKLSKEEAEIAIAKYTAAIGNEDKVLDFDKEKDKPEFYKVLDFLKKQYKEADQDMKGWLTVEIKRDFPEYEEHVKKNQPEQKDA